MTVKYYLKKLVPKTLNRSFGLKVRVALIESIVVVISCIYIFLPWNFNFNFNILCLIPVFCVLPQQITSFSTIYIGSTVFYGGIIGSFYSYIVFMITREIIWITFIITFFYSFIIASLVMIPGRKLIGGLFMKKMFLDIIVVLYFTPIDHVKDNVWQNILGAIFIYTSSIIGQIAFPRLGSRLFYLKTLKTIQTTRIYFRAIGYQLEDKLFNQTADLNIKHFQRVPTSTKQLNMLDNTTNLKESIGGDDGGGGGGGDSVSSSFGCGSNINQTTFQKVENDLIKEQQLKLSESDHLDAISVPATSSNSILNGGIGSDKLKLPIARSMIIENLNSNSNNLNSVIDIKSPLQQKQQVMDNNNNNNNGNNNGQDNEIKSTAATLDDGIKSSMDPSDNNGNFEIEKKSIEYTEKDVLLLESKIGNELIRMTTLYNESKLEHWNSELNSNYNKLLSLIEIQFKQLVSIKLSISNGFSLLSSQELITPLIPFIDCLVKEVYLQMGLMIEILSTTTTTTTNGVTESILYQSFDETKELINRVRGAYKQIVDEFQIGGHPIINGNEVSKVNFFIYGIMSFTLQQREIADLLIKIKLQQRKESIRWELIKYGLVFVVMGFPLFVYNEIKGLFQFLYNVIYKPIQKQETNKITNGVIEWIKFNMFQDGKWKYPLQVAIGLMSTICAFYYFDGVRHNELLIRGVWTCATVMIVMVPTMGGTITRGFHRFMGTIVGGIVAFLTSRLCFEIPSPGKEIVILVITFIFVFLTSFPQQDARYSYGGAVAGLTFTIIVFGQYLYNSSTFDYMYSVLRVFHILLGVIWVIILGMTVFPYFSYKGSRIKIFKITNSMSDTFINIIKLGLRLNEPINIELFNFNNSKEDIDTTTLKDERNLEILKLIDKYHSGSKHDDQLILNNIIKPIESTEEELIQKRKQQKIEILESIRSIRIGIEQVKSSLYDIRSEMVLVAPSKTTIYFTIVEKLNNSLTALVALENSFTPLFSDLMILSTFELIKPLYDLFEKFNNSKLKLNKLMAGKYDVGVKVSSSDQFQESSIQIEQKFQSIRYHLLNENMFHHLYPEMIQFGAGIHAITNFISSYNQLLDDLHFIKKEKSYLKSILRIKSK